MAHYYHFKMIMCRERGDTKAVGSKTYSESTRDVYSFEHTNDETAAADGLAAFKTALLADLASGPQHTKRVNLAAAGALGAAIDDCLGASADDASDDTEGPLVRKSRQGCLPLRDRIQRGKCSWSYSSPERERPLVMADTYGGYPDSAKAAARRALAPP